VASSAASEGGSAATPWTKLSRGDAEIRVRALVGGAPVRQETEPLIVRSTFLDPAREDGFLWGPNCSWMPATP
jgi:hypothetical protein